LSRKTLELQKLSVSKEPVEKLRYLLASVPSFSLSLEVFLLAPGRVNGFAPRGPEYSKQYLEKLQVRVSTPCLALLLKGRVESFENVAKRAF
jgi:hypothetical protein